MLENIISVISPKWAVEREKYRRAHKVMTSGKRKYDGAAKGRRTEGWFSNNNDANSEIYAGLVTLRNRSRELIRNNAYAANAQAVIVSEVVGEGIVGQVNAAKSAEVDALNTAFKDWCNSTKSDADGVFNFYGLQALIKASEFESGEVLIRRVYPKSNDYDVVPLKIQVLESDFIDTDKNQKLDTGGHIVQGIEFDRSGKRVAYWLFDAHPGGSSVVKSKRIPANDISHVFMPKRPGQVRAIPHLTPVMIPLNDLDGYEDAQLLKQKIASCFTAFITTQPGGHSSLEVEPSAGSSVSEKMEPGMIERLADGEDMKFANPPSSSDYDPSVRVALRRIATGAGITYEALTNDYSQVTFSSAKMGGIRMNKNIDNWRWNFFIPQVCDKVWEWFVEAAMVQGITRNKYKATWTPPKRELLNPKEENEADITAIRGGLSSWSEVIRSRGKDPDEQLRQMSEDIKKFDQLKIILDCDPRRIMKAGALQQPTVTELTNE